MSKMSINDAALHFGVSKEAIHNRIRRGSLQSSIEDGVKYVTVDETTPKKVTPRATVVKTTSGDERYYKLLEAQNVKLQTRVDFLENETRSLRDQREQMLIEDRIKIENIYKDKDEQLKTILSTISAQFIQNTPITPLPVEHVEAEIELEPELEVKSQKVKSKVKSKQELEKKSEKKSKQRLEKKVKSKPILISLKKYLKKEKFSPKKDKKIRKRINEIAKKDKRIITKNKKYYLNFDKHDYSDLLA